MKEITDTELYLIGEYLRKKSGFQIAPYRASLIKRRLRSRIRRHGLDDVRVYMSFMRAHPEEIPRLVSALTVHVSRFFRDLSLFTYLQEQLLLPLIRAVQKRGEKFVVLSLGCASGEEPLTLAIILAEIGCLTEANIFAMDIDTEALARCQQGLYPSAQLTEIPKSFRKNYFTRVGDQWQIDPNIAKMVTLRQGDLLLSPPLPKCDLILCRNVLIYFSRDQQVSLMRYFHALLKKGGFLVLGKSETLLGKRKAGFASYHARERIYQKL